MNPTSDIVRRESVQGLPDVKTEGALVGSFWALDGTGRGPILPAPWTRACERLLRQYDTNVYNTLWMGAEAGLVSKWQSTPWVIDGGRNLTNRFQRTFRGAQFGVGWDSFVTRIGRDFLRYNGGAWFEVIAPGDPMKPPTGPAVGIAALDSYYCLPTGDPDYPVLYYSRPTATKPQTIHILHKDRVRHLVDMEDGSQDHPGYGLCALYRAIAVVERQLYMSRYIVQMLDDKPSPGFMTIQGLTDEAWKKAWQKFKQETSNDELPEWGKVFALVGLDPSMPIKIENISLSRPPEKFDFKEYVDIDVDEMALAIGVDRQDLFPLASKSMGTGAQSQILAEKAKGKTYGKFLSLLERLLNDVLPEELTFTFKTNDPQKEAQDAATFKAWGDGLTSAGQHLSIDEGRRLLAEQVEAVESVVMDGSGQLVELTDADVSPNVTQGIEPNNNPAPAPVTEQPTVTSAGDATPNAPAAQTKDFEDTRSDFVEDFIDLVQGSLHDDVGRRRAGTVLRAQLNSYGKQAREDGLKEGGVEDGLSDDDLTDHAAWLARQSGYVTDFLDEVYGDGLTDKEVDARAEAWANKSLQEAFYEGLESADQNGLYEFVGEDGKESCATCKTLKGQVHRMKDWADNALRPGVDTDAFDCGGWQCDHNLQKTSGRASGDWLN